MHAILKCFIGNRAHSLYFHMQLFLDISNVLYVLWVVSWWMPAGSLLPLWREVSEPTFYPPWQNSYFFLPFYIYIYKWKIHLDCFKILVQLRLLCLVKFIYLLACAVNLSQTLSFTLAERLILLGSCTLLNELAPKQHLKDKWLCSDRFSGSLMAAVSPDSAFEIPKCGNFVCFMLFLTS